MKKLLGVSGLLFICILSFNEKIAEKYLNYKLSKWVEKKVYFDEFSFDYPNKIIIRGIKIENTNPIFYNNIFISSEISIDIDLKSYLFSQLVIINNLKIYKPSFFLELVEKKNQSQKNSLVSFEDNLGIAKKINENLPDKIWPKKRNDKNFLIKKSLIDKGIVFIKISSINKESKLELSDFEFTNVGNEKGFQHYKDVLKIIFFDFYARERDLEKKKILKNVYKF